MPFWRRRSSSGASALASPASPQNSGETSNSNNPEIRAMGASSHERCDDSVISDDYDVVSTPSASSTSNVHSSPPVSAEGRARRRQAYDAPPTPGFPAPTPPPPPQEPQETSSPSSGQAPAQGPRIRQTSSMDWYPDWLPRRPAGPAPASTVPSERGVGAYTPSPIPFLPPSGAGTARGRVTPAHPAAPGRHRASESYDTGYTVGTGYTGLSGVSGYGQETEGEGDQSYVDVGEIEPTEDEESRIGIGRRQTPRSVRIVSVGATGSGSKRKPVASGSVGRKPKHGHSHTHGGGQQSTGSKAWWRSENAGKGTFSAGSPTVYAPSPGVRSGPLAGATPVSAIPPHMRVYLPQPAMVPGATTPVPPKPRFKAHGLHLNILRSPSMLMYLWYLLWPLWVFGLVLIQSLLDLVGVWTIIEIALHPTPASPPSPSLLPSQSGPSLNSRSSKNWSLAAAAYVFCWSAWIFGVVIIYEVVVGWWRRWRFKRPLVFPLYLNSAAFNYVCMTSFENFCFFRYVRSTARPPLPFKLKLFGSSSSASSSAPSGRTNTPSAFEARDSTQRERVNNSEDIERGAVADPRSQAIPAPTSLASWNDYFAETFFFYSQNLPTVSLLIPRAAVCLALLLAFSTAAPEDVALAALGLMDRDRTFFRSDGSLSNFARGVLWTNVAWTGWRALLLTISWLGVWWASGMRCAGVCGPSGRWEEEEWQERKSAGMLGGGASGMACVNRLGLDEEETEEREQLQASWAWKDCVKARLFDAYDICLDKIHPSARVQEKQADLQPRVSESEGEKQREAVDDDAVLDRVLAAAGLPRVPAPARRGKLRDELFDTPSEHQMDLPTEREIEEIPVSKATSTPRSKSKSKSSKSLSREHTPPVLYPFKGPHAHTSSQDIGPERIPFPPSPKTSTHPDSVETSEVEGDIDIDIEGEEGEDEFEGYEGEDVEEFVEDPSSGRASGSMSSLGAQIPSRFPFQFRHVTRRSRGGRSSVSASSGTKSKSTGGRTRSTPERPERRRESKGSWSASPQSPESTGLQSPGPVSPISAGSSGFRSPTSPGSPGDVGSSPIPMPPRAARRGTHRRQRSSLPSLPASPVDIPIPMHVPRSRTQSASTAASETFGPHPGYETSDDEEVGDEDREERMMLTDPEPEGSQEEAERGDSVGLLSGGPSPRSSVGGLRSRSNLSLNNLNIPMGQRRRSRHSSASSHSHSYQSYGNVASSRSGGSRAQSLADSVSGDSGRLGLGARSRSVSAQARSRAHSFIQSIGAASHSTASIEMQNRARSRAHSTNSGSEASHHVAAFGTVFVPRSTRTASGSASGSGSASRSGEGSPNEEYTFGQPLHHHSLSEDSHEVRLEGPEESGPVDDSQVETAEPEGEHQLEFLNQPEAVKELHESRSNLSGVAPSEASQQTVQLLEKLEQHQLSSSSLQTPSKPEASEPIPTSGPRPLPSFISSADASMVTRATAKEGGSSSDPGAGSGSSYGTVATFGLGSGRGLGGAQDEHLPGQGGGWRPA